MRKIVLYTISSLDGAVEDPTRYFPADNPPAPPSFDNGMIRHEAALLEAQDAVLLGRGMYEQWSRYWPTSNEQPFADFINNVQKYVVTSTPLTTTWNRTQAVHGPLTSLVEQLKSLPGREIGVHGSITLAQSLLREDLIDEIQLVVGPVLDPQGPRLSAALPDLMRLKLIQADPTPGGALWLTYQRHG